MQQQELLFYSKKVLKFDFTYSIFWPEFRWKNLKIRSLLFNWLEKQTALEFFNNAHQNSVSQFVIWDIKRWLINQRFRRKGPVNPIPTRGADYAHHILKKSMLVNNLHWNTHLSLSLIFITWYRTKPAWTHALEGPHFQLL